MLRNKVNKKKYKAKKARMNKQKKLYLGWKKLKQIC